MKEQQKRIKKQIFCMLISFMVVINFIPLALAESTGNESVIPEGESSNHQEMSSRGLEEGNGTEISPNSSEESKLEVPEDAIAIGNPVKNQNEGESVDSNGSDKKSADLMGNKGSELENTPIGNDWTLGDFIYNKNRVTGFSPSGLEKVKTQKDLVLPHINPEDGTKVDTVGINDDDRTSFRGRGLTSVIDPNGSITKIEGLGSNNIPGPRADGVFAKNSIRRIQFDNVVEIGSYAFKENDISKLSLPSVKKLGPSVFDSNKLTEISENDLPKVETIEDMAFVQNSLTSVTMPSLKSAGFAAFIFNKITNAKFDNLEKAGERSFMLNKLNDVSPTGFPKLKYVEKHAFKNNPIAHIDLPEVLVLENAFEGVDKDVKVKDNFRKLEVLGAAALANKGITELTIPNINKIGEEAFANNPGVPKDNRYNEAYEGDVIIWTTNGSVPSRENYLVNPISKEPTQGEYEEGDFTWDDVDKTKITGFSAVGKAKFLRKKKNGEEKLVLPKNVKTIGSEAFQSVGVKEVSGANVEIIEDSAFWNNSLTDINTSFPKLKEIRGGYAFGANKLTNINIPTLEKVSKYAFLGNQITEVTLENVKTIGNGAFLDNKVSNIVIPVCEDIGDNVFGKNHYKEGSPVSSITAPKLKKIGRQAFMYHKLKELDLPLVEEIGLAAFSYPTKSGVSIGGNADSDPYPEGQINGFFERTLERIKLPSVKKIGDLAFGGNKIKEADIGSAQEINRRAFEGNHLKTMDLPNIKSIGAKAFKDNSIDEVKANKNCTTIKNDSFLGNRNKNKSKSETKIILTDYENPNKLKDGKVNGTREHVINPTKVTVKYIDKNQKELQKPFTEYILADKTYDAISMFGYSVDKQTKTVKDNRKENEVIFLYEKRSDIINTGGIEIRQENEKNNNTKEPKIRYHIGEKMHTHVYLDLTGIDASYSKGVLKIYYDNRYIEDGSVKVTKEGATQIKKWTAHNGVIDIELGNISGGYQLDFPIEWKFKEYVTPNKTNMEVNIQFENDGKVLSTAKPIYLEGYYNMPGLAKASPLNLPGYDYKKMSSASDGIRYMGKFGKYVTPNNTYEYKIAEATPVAYKFYPSGLERNISKFVLTDTLPTYTAVKDDGTTEERIAVFDKELNPSWTLSEDGKTVTQSKSFDGTVYLYSKIDTLYLSFPDMKSGTNVINKATIKMTPDNIGSQESDMIGEDDLSIYAAEYQNVVYEGDPRFAKEAKSVRYSQGSSQTFFFDTKEDKAKTLSYILRASSLAQKSDLVDLTITDYNLDKRLYYYGISFPYDSHTAGNVNLKVIAYKKNGEKINPTGDKKLFERGIKASKDNKIIFPEEKAKEIDYLQIIFPHEHKVNSAIEISVDTKLREPEKDAYSKKGNNIFKNYAVMAGNLYVKGTKDPASLRTEPILDEKGVAISNYTPLWDNLPGNYLWGERAEIQVRDYNEEIGFSKTQSFSKGRALKPGEKGFYDLDLVPRIYSSNGRPYYNTKIKTELKNFELLDLMPRGIEPTKITLSPEFKASGGSYKMVENYNGTGRLGIVFKTDLLKEGIQHIARIDGLISLGAPEGFITNDAYVTFDKPADKVNLFGNKEAPPNDNTNRTWLKSSESIYIIKAREMAAHQYIKKASEPGWSDTGIFTESEEEFEYKFSLYNNLDEKRTNTSMVSFFPYVGDTSIQEENIGNNVRPARNSEFENTFNLDKKIRVINEKGEDVSNNYTIKYWNSDDKIQYDNLSVDKKIENLTWSDKPAKNTRGIKVTANSKDIEINPNGSLQVIVPMRAPRNSAETGFKLTGKKAWNSFVRDDNQTIRYVEPNKVYNEMAEPLGSVEFTKYGKIGATSNDITPLPGAEFELIKFEKNDRGETVETQVAKEISDENGKVKFDNVGILGDYEIRELETENIKDGKNPGKYEKSKVVYKLSYNDFKKWYEGGNRKNYNIKVDDQKSKELFLNVQYIYGNFRMEKVNSKGQPMPKMLFCIKGLSDTNKDVNIEKYTNEDGTIEIKGLIEGKYKLIEMPINAGTKVDSGTSYVPIKPIEFVIDKEHRNIEFTGDKKIVNKEIQVLINKVAVKAVSDIPTNEELKDFTDAGKEKLKGFRFKIVEVNDPKKVIETDSTGEKGYVIVKGLKSDTLYEISEITKDNPEYKHNTKKYRFKITDDTRIVNEKGENFKQAAINFPNAPRERVGTIIIKKINDSGKLLKGAEFTLYKKGSDKEVARKITGEDGIVRFENLELGQYVIKETKSPANHKLMETSVEISINQSEKVVEKTISNPETITIRGIKTWVDNNNKDGKRPDSIVIRLMKGGKEISRKTVTAKDGWKWSFVDLPKKENGKDIIYTVLEDDVKGYIAKVEGNMEIGFKVTNTINPPEEPPVTPPNNPPEEPPVTPPNNPPEEPPVTPPNNPPEEPPVTPPNNPPENPPSKTRTGDRNMLVLLIGTVVISAVSISLVASRKQKNK